MKIAFFIPALFLFLVNRVYSSQVDLACKAIKKQDVKSLNMILKKVSFNQYEKRLLVNCADQALRDSQATALFYSETKQSMLATSCWFFIVVGCIFFEESVPSIILGMYDRRKPISFSTFFAQQNSADKQYIAAMLAATVASFSASIATALECHNGYYTDKPRYIYGRVSALK